MSALHDLAETIACPFCGAQPGQRCRTQTGRRATYSHVARTGPFYTAWCEGFEEGQEDILGALAEAEKGPEWARRYLTARRKKMEARR